MTRSNLLKRLAALAAVGVTLSACAGLGTTVAEDDPETEVPNTSMGRALMEGLGAVPARQQPINFTPRAPLVVPKDTAALAPPESAGQLAAANPNWPVDPDVETARRLREAERRSGGRDPGDTVPASELLADRLPPSSAPRGESPATQRDPATPLMPSELNKGWKSKGIDDTGVYDVAGNPRRRALTDPPVAYLEPAPGAPVAIPEEDPTKKQSFWKRISFW